MNIDYKETIERMRWAGKLKNDSAVARVLGVTPQALSNYKKRGKIPSGLLIKFAELYDLSVDWLITGMGPFQKADNSSPDPGREELSYIVKLLKVLRGTDPEIVDAMKHLVDSLSISASKDGAGEKKEAV